MFCPNCGQPITDGSTFCTNCGTRLAPASQPARPEPGDTFSSAAPAAPAYTQPAYTPPPAFDGTRLSGEVSRLKSILSSSLFLVLCIVYSVSLALGLCGGSFDILGILFCISLWITYAAAREQSAYLKSNGLRFSRGVLTADWVLTWIGIICIAVAGIILVIVLMAGGAAIDRYGRGNGYNSGFGAAIGAGIGIMLLVALVIGIAIAVLITIFFLGSLRKFSASVVSAAETGVPAYVKANASRIWLMIAGILGCLSIFSLFSGAAASSVLSDYMRQIDELRPYARYVNFLTGAGVMSSIGAVGKGVTAILASVLVGKVSR